VLVSYAVPPPLLEPRLPPGLELEKRDGKAHVSLVAFNFLDTRVFGLPWPGHRIYPELNLRYYVQNRQNRGVQFWREFVPKRLVSWMARALYNEPYQTACLSSHVIDKPASRTATYKLKWGGLTHTIEAEGRKPPYVPDESTPEHWFKEQRWGYGVTQKGRGLCYEVEHPCWRVYPVQNWRVDLEWGVVYGPEWTFLQSAQPVSVIFAEGSPVKVYPGTELRT
jgi:uncharacterized protein